MLQENSQSSNDSAHLVRVQNNLKETRATYKDLRPTLQIYDFMLIPASEELQW